MTLFNYIVIFIVAFGISLVLTPVSMVLAKKTGIMDVPEDSRRMHNEPMPRFGGFAIAVASIVTLFIFAINYRGIQPILIGGPIIFLLGAIDDKIKIPAWVKLLVEVGVAVIMYKMGLKIQFIQNVFGEGRINFNETAVLIVTVLWIVGITNAINLIDGLDGLAGGTVLINSLCLAYIMVNEAYATGRAATAIGLVTIAGACAGFLPFNFAPAKTFMGDGGSLFLGFMIASLSTIGKIKGASVITMIVPLFVLALPLFDTSFAIVRRIANKQSIMTADNRHLHHVLMQSGYGQKRAVIMLYGISGIMGIAAILLCKNLDIEAILLFFVAVIYIYVFLTDPSHNNIFDDAKKTKERDKEMEE